MHLAWMISPWVHLNEYGRSVNASRLAWMLSARIIRRAGHLEHYGRFNPIWIAEQLDHWLELKRSCLVRLLEADRERYICAGFCAWLMEHADLLLPSRVTQRTDRERPDGS